MVILYFFQCIVNEYQACKYFHLIYDYCFSYYTQTEVSISQLHDIQGNGHGFK